MQLLIFVLHTTFLEFRTAILCRVNLGISKVWRLLVTFHLAVENSVCDYSAENNLQPMFNVRITETIYLHQLKERSCRSY